MSISFLAQLIDFCSPVSNEDVLYADFLTSPKGLGECLVPHWDLILLFMTLFDPSLLSIRVSFLIDLSCAKKLDLMAVLLIAMFFQERATSKYSLSFSPILQPRPTLTRKPACLVFDWLLWGFFSPSCLPLWLRLFFTANIKKDLSFYTDNTKSWRLLPSLIS